MGIKVWQDCLSPKLGETMGQTSKHRRICTSPGASRVPIGGGLVISVKLNQRIGGVALAAMPRPSKWFPQSRAHIVEVSAAPVAPLLPPK